MADLFRPRALSVVVLVLVAGCGGTSSGTTLVTTPTAPGAGGTSSVAGCEIPGSTAGTPVGMNGGPYAHNVAIGFSADGVAVSGIAEVLPHASVPDGVLLPDGSVGIYYVNGQTDGVWVARLSGTSLVPVSPITIDGIVRPDGVVDPDATLVGGRVRLAYLNGFGAPGTRQRAMCIAESSDGINFRTIARAWALTADQQTDPTMVQLRDGSWLMAIRDDRLVRLARSGDGLLFTEFASHAYGGVAELSLTADGRVRMYTCEEGISSRVSSDGGQTWTREGTVVRGGTLGRMIICDPSWIPGPGILAFKTQ